MCVFYKTQRKGKGVNNYIFSSYTYDLFLFNFKLKYKLEVLHQTFFK